MEASTNETPPPSPPTPPTPATPPSTAPADLCALCREPKTEPEEIRCGHSFCRGCLEDLRSCRQKWARRCPLCRYPIVPISDNSDDENIFAEEQMLLEDDNLEMYYGSEAEFNYRLGLLNEDLLMNEDIYYYTASETDAEDEPETETETAVSQNLEEPAENAHNQHDPQA